MLCCWLHLHGRLRNVDCFFLNYFISDCGCCDNMAALILMDVRVSIAQEGKIDEHEGGK